MVEGCIIWVIFFGSIDDDRGGCRCHADQSPERSFVLLAMVSKEFESQKAKPWAKREVEESVERIESRQSLSKKRV